MKKKPQQGEEGFAHYMVNGVAWGLGAALAAGLIHWLIHRGKPDKIYLVKEEDEADEDGEA